MHQLAASNETMLLGDFTIKLIGAVLERLGVPFLVIDAQGRILLDNALSTAILDDGRHVGRRGDRLLDAGSGPASIAVSEFLGALRHPLEDIDLAFQAEGAPPLHASLCRLEAPYHPRGLALEPVAVMIFREASGDEAIQTLRSLYGLSEAETRVVRSVIAGIELRSQASASGVSIHTVRKQFNTAMKKVGVSSKLQLAAHLEELARLPY